MDYETDSINLEKLKPIPGKRSISGVEKTVDFFTDGKVNMAVKIYRPIDFEGQPVDVSEASKAELKAYRTLRQSSIGRFIPSPIGLVKKGNNIKGLAVEMVDYQELGDYRGQFPLTFKDIDDLEQSLMQLESQGIILLSEMLMDANLMFNPKGNPKLKFAECGIEDDTEDVNFSQEIKNAMNDLRHFYMNT